MSTFKIGPCRFTRALMQRSLSRGNLRIVILCLGILCLGILWIGIFGASLSQHALAQGLAVENKNIAVDEVEYHDVASALRCPTCTGLSVLDSEAAFSIQIKNEVKEQLAAGKDKDTILKFFTERYGPWILRAPPTEGLHLLVWVVPIGAMILGPLVIWFFVWMRRKTDTDDEIVSRSVEEIVVEMNQRLAAMRVTKGGHS
jgi:cytochrome c-type biogenesis protein CcmH/NrfF